MTEAMSLAARLRLDAGALQLLAECGYLLLDRGAATAAAAVFAGLEALVPEDPVGALGRAEVARSCGDRTAARTFARAARRCARADATAHVLAYRLEAAVSPDDLAAPLLAAATAIESAQFAAQRGTAADRVGGARTGEPG